MSALKILLLALALVLPSVSFGQTTTNTKTGDDLIGSWLVSVEGEARNRTLRITGVTPTSEGSLTLEAVYGWTDGNQTAVSAEVTQAVQERKLFVTTQPGTKIVTRQGVDGKFSGTFTLKNGVTKGVTISKASEEELQSKIAERIATLIKKPAADVPSECAAFSGRWTGKWGDGKQYWLWIIEVSRDCVATFANLQHSRPPVTPVTGKIRGGVLSYICNSSTGGSCEFRHSGGEISARYFDSSGGNDSSTFKKID